ncbi:MAG: ABC transporter ATP-binding protein [Selenomonas sp.]|nr:ABC transporter ATP-binding protein [Selenomonas sp.]
MSELVIEAEKLTMEFASKNNPTVTALDSFDFSLAKGSFTALVGPDGAGKTTFLRLVAGLLTPTDGKLTVLGREIMGHEQEIQDLISYMPQKFGLYEDLSVAENMNLYADLHGVPQELREERFSRLLEKTGLVPFAKRAAGKLSGGMKQKLALACTLVRSPEILLLDEPNVGVDPLFRRELWQIVQDLVKKERLSVLVNTAYMDEAELTDEVYVLNRGKLLTKGSPEELRKKAAGRCYSLKPPEGGKTRILQGMLMDDKEAVVDAVPESGKVRFICRAGKDAAYFRQKYGLPLKQETERLEDAFMLLLHEDMEKRGEEKADQDLGFKPLSLSGPAATAIGTDIVVKNLLRKFGDFTAVNKTSFEVHRGEVFGLLGPNGAGKTTTFRMLCGLLAATDGFLSVAGVNLRTARTEARGNIGYVAQKFSLYGDFTVRENLAFFGGVYGLSHRELEKRIDEVLREFRLTEVEDTAAKMLPGGYKQRLSMAAALLHKPKILFLDEPTSGIDPLARRTFWRQITDLSAGGTTVIITTHFMEEAEYCDRMMIQDHGELLAIGTPSEIREKLNDGDDISMNEVFIRIVEKTRQTGGLA